MTTSAYQVLWGVDEHVEGALALRGGVRAPRATHGHHSRSRRRGAVGGRVPHVHAGRVVGAQLVV